MTNLNERMLPDTRIEPETDKHLTKLAGTVKNDNWILSFIWELVFTKLQSRSQINDIFGNLQRKSVYYDLFMLFALNIYVHLSLFSLFTNG